MRIVTALLLLHCHAMSAASPPEEAAGAEQMIAHVGPSKAPARAVDKKLNLKKPADLNVEEKAGSKVATATIAHVRSVNASKKRDGALTVGAPSGEDCSTTCGTCSEILEYVECERDEWVDPSVSCAYAADQCSSSLDITCTPESGGSTYVYCKPNDTPTPGLGGAGCDAGYVKLFNASCVITPLGVGIYIVLGILVLGILVNLVKKCCFEQDTGTSTRLP